MSDTTDLISRLRAVCETGCDPDLPFEAADALEAMSERLAFHVAFTREAQDLCSVAQAQVREQAREIEALRADAERLCGELVALIPSEAA